MKLNLLVAYPYFLDPILQILKETPRDRYRLIIDSGAFTAWNIGKQISLPEYCKFLDRVGPQVNPDHYVQLDVFGDPEQTWKNFLEMERCGYAAMPVFTRGECPEMLEEMYARTDYIMFGGIVTGAENTGYCKWFDRINKGRKAHWLGFAKTEWLKVFKPYSVDASSWNGSMRFGGVNLYGGNGNISRFERQDINAKNWQKIVSMARTCGITPDDLLPLKGDAAWRFGGYHDFLVNGKGTACYLSTISHVKRALDIEKHLGTRLYLAVTQKVHIFLILKAYEFLKERKVI